MLQLVRLVSRFHHFCRVRLFFFPLFCAGTAHPLGMSADAETLTADKNRQASITACHTPARPATPQEGAAGVYVLGARCVFPAVSISEINGGEGGFNAISMVYAFPWGLLFGNSVVFLGFRYAAAVFFGWAELRLAFGCRFTGRFSFSSAYLLCGGGGANQVGGERA